MNSAGYSDVESSNPAFAVPALEIPGVPHTVRAVTGVASGQIQVTWQYPCIPWHGTPCSGLPSNPIDCPAPIGDSIFLKPYI